MKWLSKLFRKGKTTSSTRIVAESPPSTLSTWMTLLASQELYGQQSTHSRPELNTIEFMASLQDSISTRAKLECEEAQQRLHIAQEITRPHRVYNPRLTHDGIEWVCVWGSDPESQLVGRGNSPGVALMNFDLAWFGKPPTKELG